MGRFATWKSANTARLGSSPSANWLITGLPELPAHFLCKSLEMITMRICGKGSAQCLELKKLLVKGYLLVLL